MLTILLLTACGGTKVYNNDKTGPKVEGSGCYLEATGKFTSPEQIGAALFMAGEFEDAGTVFGRSGTAKGSYNRGNAMVMQGLYDEAIEYYQSALIKGPNWSEAEQNLQITSLREQAMPPPDDDAGGTGG